MAAADLHHHGHGHAHGDRRKVVAAYGALGGLSALVLLRDPLEHTVFPPCPLHATTGLFCPACGATRASSLLLRGQPLEAMHYNLLWVLLVPVVVYALVAWGAGAFGVRIPRVPNTRLVTGGLLVLLAVFFVVRNIPGLDALNPPAGS